MYIKGNSHFDMLNELCMIIKNSPLYSSPDVLGTTSFMSF